MKKKSLNKFGPRTNIILYSVLATSVFISDSFKVSVILLGAVVIAAIKVPFSMLRRGLVPITLFLLFTFLSNVLFQDGKVVYHAFGLSVTDLGLLRGGLLTLKLVVLILGAKVLTATTGPEGLVNGMSELLGPMGKISFVKELIFTMSLTLRLLPIVYDEALELYKDVKSSEGTSFTGKIRLAVSLLTPLFERSLKKAKEMPGMEREHGH